MGKLIGLLLFCLSSLLLLLLTCIQKKSRNELARLVMETIFKSKVCVCVCLCMCADMSGLGDILPESSQGQHVPASTLSGKSKELQ